MILLIWYVLEAIAAWKIFAKAGKPGWHAFIPILNVIDEYDLSWNSGMGILFLFATFISNYVTNSRDAQGLIVTLGSLAGAVVLVLHIMQSLKLAKCFGKGTGYGIFLIILGPLARIILGLSDAEYIGPAA